MVVQLGMSPQFPSGEELEKLAKREHRRSMPLDVVARSLRPGGLAWQRLCGQLTDVALAGRQQACLAVSAGHAKKLANLGFVVETVLIDPERNAHLRHKAQQAEADFLAALTLLNQKTDLLKRVFVETTEACPKFRQAIGQLVKLAVPERDLVDRFCHAYPLARHVHLEKYGYLLSDLCETFERLQRAQGALPEPLPDDLADGEAAVHKISWSHTQATSSSPHFRAETLAWLSGAGQRMLEILSEIVLDAATKGRFGVLVCVRTQGDTRYLVDIATPQSSLCECCSPEVLSGMLEANGMGVVVLPPTRFIAEDPQVSDDKAAHEDIPVLVQWGRPDDSPDSNVWMAN
jgi:hypothetical protein